MVKHVVKAHGGRVGVKSELGKGAAFTVLLPVAEARKP
jgi:signal transduction histidine kinase